MSEAIQTVLVDHTDPERILHLQSTERWMEPVCGANGIWLDKPATMYPHYEVCPACATEQSNSEVSDE